MDRSTNGITKFLSVNSDTHSEQRRLRSAQEEIAYVLKRSAKRKTIGLKIDHEGLTVHAPWRASEKWLIEVLHKNEKWIQRKLDELARDKPPAIEWHGDVKLLFLGQPLQLKIFPRPKICLQPPYLYVPETAPFCPMALRASVIKWYKEQALRHFSGRVASYAKLLGVPVPPVRLSNAQHLWGSCNTKGEIRVNWRLIQASEVEIDYVVAHELAHLIELNHSRKFWKIVEGIYPSYVWARQQLRHAQAQYYGIDGKDLRPYATQSKILSFKPLASKVSHIPAGTGSLK